MKAGCGHQRCHLRDFLLNKIFVKTELKLSLLKYKIYVETKVCLLYLLPSFQNHFRKSSLKRRRHYLHKLRWFVRVICFFLHPIICGNLSISRRAVSFGVISAILVNTFVLWKIFCLLIKFQLKKKFVSSIYFLSFCRFANSVFNLATSKINTIS